jgi:hypothetical protein
VIPAPASHKGFCSARAGVADKNKVSPQQISRTARGKKNLATTFGGLS